jgi:hypothetical protein
MKVCHNINTHCGFHKVFVKKAFTILALLLSFVAWAGAETDPWTPLQFLVGTWQGDGKAEDASGKGVTTFDWEVGHQLLVRHDRTEYSATAQRAAFTYEALMVIYKNPASNKIEASYFDGENHVIRYQMSSDSQPDSVQFVSDAAGGPVFRLSYKLANRKDLSVTFEMQPPGSTVFQTIASGVVHKQ